MRRSLSTLLAASIALVAFSAGCSKEKSTGAAPDAGTPTGGLDASATPSTPGVPSKEEGRALARNACLSCHSEEMLAQQRLTSAQWTKVVTKMVGWGANLEPNDTAPLTAWLAATYGPDAGPYEPATIDAGAAADELAAQPDGPFGNGDAERGRPLYIDRCSGCHGADARGHIGVNLIDRPFLYRASDFATTIRRGRGKMTPLAMSDAEIADVLSYLRSLKNP